MDQDYEDYDYGSGNYDNHEESFGHKHHFLDDIRKSLGIHRIHRSTSKGRKGDSFQVIEVPNLHQYLIGAKNLAWVAGLLVSIV